MSDLQALILGIVQGLTEFLPISSSGHLILVPWIGDFTYLRDHPDFNKTFDVALHFGTLVGVVAYFRHEVLMILRGTLRLAANRVVRNDDDRLALLIIIGTIPAVVAGALGEKYIDEHLGEPWQIAILLIVFGLLLAWADRRPQERTLKDLGPAEAVKVGLAQMLALAPGVSRSGVTITAARALGLDRDSAARLSFLLLVPAVAGAVVYKGGKVAIDGLPPGVVQPMVIGVIAAAVSGYLAIWGLLRFVRTHSYDVFVIYRLIAAAVVILLIVTGVKSASF
jgi:undecaprenyl-diphosphatase